MNKIKTCPWCGAEFIPEHGNHIYCSSDHQFEAKKDRQKTQRDPIKKFLPILRKNHEILESLYSQGLKELTANEIKAYQIDTSLCRHLKPTLEHVGKIKLDFGLYFLITDTLYLTFKIFKNDSSSTIWSQ